MKKLLFLLTVCVISLPLRASDLSDALCNDEVFISFCNEAIEVTQLMKSLSTDKFTSNSDVTCLKENLAYGAIYLKKTYLLFKNSDETTILLKEAFNSAMLSNKIAQQVQPDCLFEFMQFSSWCSSQYPYPYLSECAACLILADALYLSCMGIP